MLYWKTISARIADVTSGSEKIEQIDMEELQTDIEELQTDIEELLRNLRDDVASYGTEDA